MRPDAFTLYDVLERNAAAFGDTLALVTEDGHERTFDELRRRVDALAAGLFALGLRQGDRVAVLALNSAAYVEVYFACARQGLLCYPINWRLTAPEVARIVARARPRAFVFDAPSRGALPERAACDTVEHWLAIDDPDEPEDAGVRPLAELYGAPPLARLPVADDLPVAAIATAAVDIMPRCALLSHRNLVCSNLQEIASLSLSPRDRTLAALPLFHIAGLGHTLAFLHAGGAAVILPRFDAARAVELIDRWRITHLSSFPPVCSQVLDAASAAGSKLESLRLVTGLDAPATMDRLHRETAATFWTGFGQTETSGFVTLQNVRERSGCAGRPAELCRVEVVDDYDRPLPFGEAGEIVVRGPLVFLGYDGQDEVTAYTFRNGWHHTGDVGRFDDLGHLYYVKRKAEKELIKPGGENVYPAEVEAVIVELAGIAHACVFGIGDERWGEAIKAVVELEPKAEQDPPTPQQIIDHVGTRIARFKRPKVVEVVDRLPRASDGSVDRDAVKKRWGS